jgi:protein TonB
MKKIIPLTIFLFAGIFPAAQFSFGEIHKGNLVVERQNEDSVYTWVDEMPQFPGDSMNKFLRKNLRSFGTVTISFIVEKDGSLSDIHVSGDSSELSKDIVRVFSLMPKWLPGKLNGKIVRVRITQRMSFCPG